VIDGQLCGGKQSQAATRQKGSEPAPYQAACKWCSESPRLATRRLAGRQLAARRADEGNAQGNQTAGSTANRRTSNTGSRRVLRSCSSPSPFGETGCSHSLDSERRARRTINNSEVKSGPSLKESARGIAAVTGRLQGCFRPRAPHAEAPWSIAALPSAAVAACSQRASPRG